MIEVTAEGTPEYGLEITGMTHTLSAMHVDGERWIGLLSIESPSRGALLQPEDALALRDWLNQRLLNFASANRAEHDEDECEKARRDGYLADLCLDCYIEHTAIQFVDDNRGAQTP